MLGHTPDQYNASGEDQGASQWKIVEDLRDDRVEAAEEQLNPELFNAEQCRVVMDAIPAPTGTPEGMNRVMAELSSRHERRILGYMVGGAEGFAAFAEMNEGDLASFAQRYPSPADFDAVSADFLDLIVRLNGEEKGAQYAQAMDGFKRKIFGAKQVYYDQMKELGVDWQEKEKSAEWEPGVAGVMQVSKTELRRRKNEGGRLEYGTEADYTCQDAYILCPDQGVYGVFDGAGGHEGGRTAARAAAAAVGVICDRYNPESSRELANMLNAAGGGVARMTRGRTTAVLAKVVEREGQQFLNYASVGDSRIYVVRANGEVQQVTEDEVTEDEYGRRRILTNALGETGSDKVRQFGELPVGKGDRIVMCSDGIVGDDESELMSNEEIGAIVSRAESSADAAAQLLMAARKTDDRTALCFGV